MSAMNGQTETAFPNFYPILTSIILFLFLFPTTQSEAPQSTAMYLCHPDNPRLFLRYVPNFGMVKMECPRGLLFNSVIKACDWPSNSDCTPFPNSVGAATGPTVTSRDSYKIHVQTWKKKHQQLKYNPTKKDNTSTENPTRRRKTAPKAKACNPKTCKLPNCKCPDDSIPGSLNPKSVPQIVLLTFDDSINFNNIDYYKKIHEQNLTNPNGCPIGMTFFVSGSNNDYRFIKRLYEQGHEIASHSQTHRFPVNWWSSASYKEFKDEMVGMRQVISKRASIPIEKIKGSRVPFLQLDGDIQYGVLKDYNFTWDSSMVSRRFKRPIWPFTLDHSVSVHHCQIERCPKRSHPGLWEVPLIQWQDKKGVVYAMPDVNTKPKRKMEMFDFFRRNFEAHYHTNRAPFGIFIHATWFNKKPFNFEVLQGFLSYLSAIKDVWVIPVSQAIDWVRNPKPMSALAEIDSWNCNRKRM